MHTLLLLSGPLLLLVLVLGLAACGERSGDDAAPWRGEGVEIEVTVSPIHCQGCELAIETALGEVEGVRKVKADHLSKKVHVWLDGPDARDAVIAKVRETLHEQERLVVGEDEIPDED